MNRNLEAYIAKTSFLDKDFCNETIEQLENNNLDWQQHEFYSAKTGKSNPISGNQELDCLYTDKVDNTSIIIKNVFNEIYNYIENLNFSWYNGWHGYTAIRYNRYAENKKMALHCDHIWSMFDGERKGIPTLSILGALNDNYEGGEFIMFDDYKIELKQGELLIFPSNFLYPHRVEPVTSGVRYTYVSWVW